MAQDPCFGKRHLFSAEELAAMDVLFTAKVEKDLAQRQARDQDNLATLKMMMENGHFHHATYRNINTLWEGWHIYEKASDKEGGFRGFKHALMFGKESHVLKQVEDLIRGTGYSVGSYGQG